MNTIAAVLTCHNRCDKTLRCLRSLKAILPDAAVYLTDDGCTDGTSAAVQAEYPDVHIIKGDGSLFWNRGMRLAWETAVAHGYDDYLWLNDDVDLYSFFFEEMMECRSLVGQESIITGMIEDRTSGDILYGGCRKDKSLISTSDIPQEVTYMNGNVVLVHSSVVSRIGILDGRLHHDLGDVDYGLTARSHGITVVCTRRPVAAGVPNNYCRVRRWGTTLANRFRILQTPLGSPLGLNYYFRRKHVGVVGASLYCLHLIVLNLLPDCLVKFLWGDKYIDQ